MATPQEFLVAFLKADAAITNLIGTAPFRMYPETVPEGATYPRLTYQVIDWPEVKLLSGRSGYGRPRIQIDVWAKGPTAYADAWALALAVKNSTGGSAYGPKLDDYHGVFANVDVRRIRLVDRRDQWEAPIHAEELPVRRVILDFVVELME